MAKKKNTNYIHKNTLRNIVNAWKQGQGCSICKREFDPAVLDCHHIHKETKSFNISEGVSRGCSTDRMKAELAKCDVHCANCHRRREYFQRKERAAKGLKNTPYDMPLMGIWENKRKDLPKTHYYEFEPERGLF